MSPISRVGINDSANLDLTVQCHLWEPYVAWISDTESLCIHESMDRHCPLRKPNYIFHFVYKEAKLEKSWKSMPFPKLQSCDPWPGCPCSWMSPYRYQSLKHTTNDSRAWSRKASAGALSPEPLPTPSAPASAMPTATFESLSVTHRMDSSLGRCPQRVCFSR